MLGEDATIKAVITAQDKASAVLKKFGQNVDDVSSDGSKKLGGRFTAATAAVGVGLLAAGAAAVKFGVESFKAFEDSEAKVSQLNAVIKSTAGVAGVTAEAAIALSKSLQEVTTYSDEDVLSVENLLLTFTSISKDIFPQATKTVLDMATALGEDTKSASIQLGKALQDPILGITALRRVGVNFSDDQKKVIENLVETGRKAEAQQLILKELNTEFGGSAQAAADTYAGKIKQLGNKFNDLQENIGKLAATALPPVLDKLNEVVGDLNDLIGDNTKLVDDNFRKEQIARIGKSDYTLAVDRQRQAEENLQRSKQNELTWAQKYDDARKNQKLATDDAALAQEKFNLAVQTYGQFSPQGIQAEENLKNKKLELTDATKKADQAFRDMNESSKLAKTRSDELKASNQGVNDTMYKTKPASEVLGSGMDIIYGKAVGPVSLFGALKANVEGSERAIKNFAQTVNNISFSSKIADQLNALSGAANNFGPRIGSPFRASGGSVSSSTPYIVGEEGPEVFVPNSSGSIVPNDKLRNSSGKNNINLSVNVGVYAGTEQEKRKVAKELFNALGDIASSKNMTVAELLA